MATIADLHELAALVLVELDVGLVRAASEASSLHQPAVFWPLKSFSSDGIWSQTRIEVSTVGSGATVWMYIARS